MDVSSDSQVLSDSVSLTAGESYDFEDAYERYADFIYRSAIHLGISSTQAEDVVQKVFLVAHRKLSDFEGRSTVKTWLFSILLRVVRDEKRTRRRRIWDWMTAEPETIEQVRSTEATAFESLSAKEACETLDNLLARLPSPKREVFVLAELEEMTAKEIAEATGMTPQQVYTTLRAARTDFERAAAPLRKAQGIHD